jgi:hypothetical protein
MIGLLANKLTTFTMVPDYNHNNLHIYADLGMNCAAIK